MKKPIVGQILFSLNVGNAARYKEQALTEVRVFSVGRKYFVTRNIGDNTGYSAVEYFIDGWCEKTVYSANSALYETAQDWLDKKEIGKLCKEIGDSFNYGSNSRKLSLDVIKAIHKIVFES